MSKLRIIEVSCPLCKKTYELPAKRTYTKRICEDCRKKEHRKRYLKTKAGLLFLLLTGFSPPVFTEPSNVPKTEAYRICEDGRCFYINGNMVYIWDEETDFICELDRTTRYIECGWTLEE